MADIAYSFNHERLLNKLSDFPVQDVLLSVVGLLMPETTKTCMHVIAHFLDSDGFPINVGPEVSCPYPPGWQPGRYNTDGLNFDATARYIIPADQLRDSLNLNDFVDAGIKQLKINVVPTIEKVLHTHEDGSTVELDTLISNIKVISLNVNGTVVKKEVLTKTFPVPEQEPEPAPVN